MIVVFLFFFFFKQKTAYEMRISDWSSDVCSSDLPGENWRTISSSTESPVSRRPDIRFSAQLSFGTADERRQVTALVGSILGNALGPKCTSVMLEPLGGGRDRKSTRLNSSH